MTKLIDNGAYWRSRAEETRVISESMTEPKTIEALRKIAEDYEILGRMADEREEQRRRTAREKDGVPSRR